MDAIRTAIDAALTARAEKKPILEKLRRSVELLKQLIRISRELHIISDAIYLELQKQIQEISKMTNGWLKYITEKGVA